jgi:hypothetical protein
MIYQLFEDKVRKRFHPKEYSEPLYEFYDSHRHGCYESYRQSINSWLEKLPTQEQKEIVGKMRSGSAAYNSGILELVFHSMLKNFCDDVIVHPKLNNKISHPDFYCKNLHGQNIYVEVTTANFNPKDLGREKRKNNFLNAINSLELPQDIGVELQLKSVGAESLSKTFIANSLNLEDVDFSSLNSEFVSDYNQVSDKGWRYRIRLRKLRFDRSYGSLTTFGPSISTSTDIEDYRKSLSKKAKKYGSLGKPFILVVSSSKRNFSPSYKRLAFDALFGSEAIIFTRGSDETKIVRNDDGFFCNQILYRSERVSAVVFVADIGLHAFEKRPPIVFFNPFCEFGLTKNLFPTMNIYEYLTGEKNSKLTDVLPLTKGWDADPWAE